MQFEPRQIDYIAVDRCLLKGARACTQECAATTSDHRLLSSCTWEHKLFERTVEVSRRKLLRWTSADPERYNRALHERLTLPLTDNGFNYEAAYIAATDGSWSRSDVRTAGWGFVLALPGVSIEDDPEELVASACGNVATNPKSTQFVGAERTTNKTAEVTGLIELFIYLLGHYEELKLFSDSVD